MPRRRGLRPRLLAAVIRSKATSAFAAERQVVRPTGESIMQRWRLAVAVAVLVGALAIAKAHSESGSFIPEKGFVPDAATATRIAEAVWIPIYGEAAISKEKPFKANLHSGVWTVTGKDLPPGSAGGVAEADISKRDGRILRVIHGK